MQTRRLALPSILLLAASLLAGCGPTTKLTSVWSADATQRPKPQKILVVGALPSPTVRRRYEEHVAQAIAELGTPAVASYVVIPSEGKLTEAQIKNAADRGGFDAALLTWLVNIDEKTTYVPPSGGVSMGGYHGMYGHYGHGFGVSYSPGYTTTTTIVQLETHLYNETELLWSATSDTFNPNSADAAIASVTKKVMKRLAEDGFIAGE